MKIKINDTNETGKLSIIDPNTGCDWIVDLMGNHNALPTCDDDGNYLMDLEDYEWWLKLTTEYQNAEYRKYKILNALDNDEVDNFYNDLCDCDPGDLEDYPDHINSICDDYENN